MRRISLAEELLLRPVVLMLGFFIAGILLAVKKQEGICFILFVAAITVLYILILVQVVVIKDKGVKSGIILRYLVVVCLIPLMTVCGFLRFEEKNERSSLNIKLTSKTKGTAEGVITGITIKPQDYVLSLKNVTVSIGDEKLSSCGITVSVPKEELFDYKTERKQLKELIGLTVICEGTLYPNEAAHNPGQFDADIYYRARQTDARMYAKGIGRPVKEGEVTEEKTKYSLMVNIKRMLFSVKAYMCTNLFNALPHREAAILCAMLTGEKSLLDDEVKELFNEGSISHVLSISGLHVSLLGMGLYGLLMKVSGRLVLSIYITMAVMTLYGILTGFSVSTMRAVIMLLVSLFGQRTGKVYDGPSGGALAAFIILMINPLYLFDGGFRMSFVAVLGIFAGNALLSALGIKKPENSSLHIKAGDRVIRRLREDVLMIVILQLFLAPVLMRSYFEVNLLSVPVNMIVLPLMSTVVACGGLCGLLTGIPSKLAGGASYYILLLYEELCRLAARIPEARFLSGEPSVPFEALYYLILFGITILIIKKKNSFPLVLLPLCAVLFIKPYTGSVDICFLDVGQGDSIYFSVMGEDYLFDGGSSSVNEIGKYRLIPFFKSRGIRSLKGVFVSHTDMDHISGITEIIEEGFPRIEALYISICTAEDEKLVSLAKDHNIRVIKLCGGCRINENITILAPVSDRSYTDKNSASLVAQIAMEDFNVLLTGDIDSYAEKMMLEELAGETGKHGNFEVLKVAHHGSRYSSSDEFLRIVRPEFAVVSCGRANSYGHPSRETLVRLEAVKSRTFVTYETGMVEVSYNENSESFGVRKWVK